MPPGRDGNVDGRFAVPGRMPEGNCEALLPMDGRLTPEGRSFDGVLEGDDGTRPAAGLDAPVDGWVDGRVDGRAGAEGRDTFEVAGLETPPEGRE